MREPTSQFEGYRLRNWHALSGIRFAGRLLRPVTSVASAFFGRYFIHGSAANNRQRHFGYDIVITDRALGVVVLLNEQPVVTLFSGPATHAGEMPTAMQFLPWSMNAR